MIKNILIFDDDVTAREKFIKLIDEVEILSECAVEGMDNEQFSIELRKIQERRMKIRNNLDFEYDSFFDNVDVLIIDFDLIAAMEEPSFITAENVAELLRCFSKVGMIIGVNRFGTKYFDLTLRGHLDSYCDMNIGEKHLENSGLWTDNYVDFRPWYWYNIPLWITKFEKRVEVIETNLKNKILEVIGFNSIQKYIQIKDLKFLGTKNFDNITFEDFVKNSGNGLKSRKDAQCPNELQARICASRVFKWIDKALLPNQDILIDAPHLCMRYPSLFNTPSTKQELDNLTIQNSFTSLDKARKHEFRSPDWTLKPVWKFPEIQKDETIIENDKPWLVEDSKFVFCEDASKFFEKESCTAFKPEIDAPYIFRYIKEYPGYNYRPLKVKMQV